MTNSKTLVTSIQYDCDYTDHFKEWASIYMAVKSLEGQSIPWMQDIEDMYIYTTGKDLFKL